MRGPKRRDIGHGALAQRALEAMIPPAGGLPVHDPDRLGDARVERLVVDGLGVRLDARADGRRRADQVAGLRHRDGPRQGGRRLRHPHRHPGRGGPPGRHGLQGRRHAGRDHRAPDGHQDHRRHAGDHARRRSIRRSGRASSILDRMLEALPEAAHGAGRACAADLVGADQPGLHRHGDRQGRRDDPLARVGVRRPDRHRGGRHDPRLRDRGHEGGRRDRGDHGADQGARGGGHLHRQGREDDRSSARSSS